MALLSPLNKGIQEVLNQTRLAPRKDQSEIADLLDRAGLGPIEVLEEVGEILRNGDNENSRLRAAEIGLKLNRLLVDNEGVNAPVVNIIINDSEYSQINPILIPR